MEYFINKNNDFVGNNMEKIRSLRNLRIIIL